jgi:hypothetical protein
MSMDPNHNREATTMTSSSTNSSSSSSSSTVTMIENPLLRSLRTPLASISTSQQQQQRHSDNNNNMLDPTTTAAVVSTPKSASSTTSSLIPFSPFSPPPVSTFSNTNTAVGMNKTNGMLEEDFQDDIPSWYSSNLTSSTTALGLRQRFGRTNESSVSATTTMEAPDTNTFPMSSYSLGNVPNSAHLLLLPASMNTTTNTDSRAVNTPNNDSNNHNRPTAVSGSQTTVLTKYQYQYQTGSNTHESLMTTTTKTSTTTTGTTTPQPYSTTTNTTNNEEEPFTPRLPVPLREVQQQQPFLPTNRITEQDILLIDPDRNNRSYYNNNNNTNTYNDQTSQPFAHQNSEHQHNHYSNTNNRIGTVLTTSMIYQDDSNINKNNIGGRQCLPLPLDGIPSDPYHENNSNHTMSCCERVVRYMFQMDE